MLKELNETRVWLLITAQAEMLAGNRLEGVLDECDQLCRIISASIQAARRNSKGNNG